MMQGLLQILLFWLLGESLHYLADLPVSGNVLGMLLLFFYLLISRALSSSLEQASQQLIGLLSLLLLPGGVGIFFMGERLQGQWLPLLSAIIIGSLLSIVATLLIMQYLSNRHARRR